MKFLKRLAFVVLLMFIAIGGGSWFVAGQLIAPQLMTIPAPPPAWHAESVSIAVPQANPVRGWWVPGKTESPSVLLLHGIRSHRGSMIGRANTLLARGYSVLLIDLPGHGESTAEMITLGVKESAAVVAAREWIQQHNPGQKIGVIGTSLGGASVLLGPMPSPFDAVVLEAVYSTAHHAIENRLVVYVGTIGAWLTPLLEWQIEPRLGVKPEALSPIDRIAALGAPVLIVAGGKDQRTTLEESQALFQRAKAPKQFWVLPTAGHEDFYARDPQGYETQVIGFLESYLK